MSSIFSTIKYIIPNIWNQYQHIAGQLLGDPNKEGELDKEALPYFARWLIKNVSFVVITTSSDADAYTVFETVNDRGRPLTPTDMLKAYLLANIRNPELRKDANEFWRKRVTELKDLGTGGDADAIKAWLRSQHADTIRERKRGATPRDFSRIGTEFHRWVDDQQKQGKLPLKDSDSFYNFIQTDFDFYSHWFKIIRKAAEEITPGLETIHYNYWNNFTLQYPVLLAPLQPADSKDEEQIRRKLRIVATYIDILITRRIWNGKTTAYSSMSYAMFQLIKEIRRQPADDLAGILIEHLRTQEEIFCDNGFGLHGTNRPKIRRLLARMTDYVETRSSQPSRPHYDDYIEYEVEHIWADKFERHEDEFDHPSEFTEYRNRIGGLLLLPKNLNASYSAISYEEKREHYIEQNWLAKSLHKGAYVKNPGFLRFINETGLEFKPHPEFKKADLDTRQKLYQALAERIWDPENLRHL